MRARARRYGSLVVLALLVVPAPAPAAVCDTSGLGGIELGSALDAIDAACPCVPGEKTGARLKCAKAVVAARIAGGQLAATCKSTALWHVTKSVCNRPGAVVCCRVKTNTKTAHKIARDPGRCVDTARIAACISAFPSVPRGCNATGCISSTCGNSVIEPGESCDPPMDGLCDATCEIVPCGPPVSACGNGVLDAGEACDPPGVGSCSKDCQAAPCTPGGPGEIAVACVEGAATVGAGSGGSDYLLAWTGPTYRPEADIVARRFDADGAPLDPAAQVVSAGVPCGSAQADPAVGGDGNGYVVEWRGFGPLINQPGLYAHSIYARPYDNAAALGSLDELAMAVPFGMCTGVVTAPLAIAPAPLAGPRSFAALWEMAGGCLGIQIRDPDGTLLDYTTPTPTRTTMTIGYFPVSVPGPLSDGAATIASLPGDTLAAWHVHLQNSSPPYVSNPSVAGAWLAGSGTTTQFIVSSRKLGVGPLLRPTVAAATDRFLVAWAEGPVDDATEIRAMRVTHASGPLDPDGGLLLATTAGGAVHGGPVAAFDGGVWLVVWTEAGVGGDDLRAVAVAVDGTVVDATPRLLASGLGDAEPAIAARGDGRALVVYVRPDAGGSAVRAQLVPGS